MIINILFLLRKTLLSEYGNSSKSWEIVIDTAQSCSNSIAITSDDKYIVYCNRDYTLGLISLKARRKLADLQGHANQVDALL